MPRVIDHVTVAGRDLEAMRSAFESAGFEATYGGTHSNGITHMYSIGFEDRSYVELVSKNDPEATAPWWNERIDGDAGAAAWALPSEDIATDSERLESLGFAVEGPESSARERPDGSLVEWALTVVGDRPQGGILPMLIEDHTPLDRRVTVTMDAETTGLSGLVGVVIGTDELEALAERFEAFFDADPPSRRTNDGLGARIADFEGEPVAIAEPLGDDSWLAERVTSHGTLPCAYLLAATDLETVRERFDVRNATPWGEDTVHWIDADVEGEIGVLEP